MGQEEPLPPRRLSGRCGVEGGRWPSMLMSRRCRLLGQVLRRGLMLIREGARPQAGAHARVRELATMTAAEPETGAVFRHNAR
jgi:hypothetical protein